MDAAPSEEELAFARSFKNNNPNNNSEGTEISKLKSVINQLRQENDILKRQAFEALSDSEKSQEQISNRLIRQIEKMRKERAELVNAVEAEEEYLTNVLQKRLETVQKQKDQLEGTIENDREAIISKLQNQIELLCRQNKNNIKDFGDLESIKEEIFLLKNKFHQRELECKFYYNYFLF